VTAGRSAVTTRPWLAAVVVVAVAVMLTLAFGAPYGSNNQLTYLLEPLRHAFPDLYHHDWLVAETTPYHPVFAWVAAPLFAVDAKGRVAFGVAQLVVQIATYVLIYRFVCAIAASGRVVVYVLLASLLAVGAAISLAYSYLFSGYLQPSSLATLGWLAAMIAYARDRPLVCGLSLAVAGVWHVNFLVLGVGLFGTLELVESRGRVRVARLAQLLVPSLVVLAVFLPSLIASSRASEPDLALWVLQRFHAPAHYNPKQIRHYVPSLVCWVAVAWGLRGLATGDAAVRALRFALVGTALCVAAVVIASIPPLAGTTRLYVWRIGPFAQLASQALVLVGAVRAITEPPPRGTFDRWSLLAVIAGGATLVAITFHQVGGDYPRALALACGGVVLAFAISHRVVLVRVWAGAVLAVVVMCAVVAGKLHMLVDPPLFATTCYGPECGLETWAQTTPVDAVFLVPPYMNGFRLGARRAVVADTKSPPLYPDELVAWYRRLCAVVGVSEAPSTAEIEARWDTLRGDQLLAIARRFAVDYLVLDKTRTAARVDAPVAYEDAGRIVYRVGT
jgi:hypothetical protein